jgi:hypothetical protein
MLVSQHPLQNTALLTQSSSKGLREFLAMSAQEESDDTFKTVPQLEQSFEFK